MKTSTDRILTTHAGSLSRPANLIALSRSIAVGEAKSDDPAYAQTLAASVADVVKNGMTPEQAVEKAFKRMGQIFSQISED